MIKIKITVLKSSKDLSILIYAHFNYENFRAFNNKVWRKQQRSFTVLCQEPVTVLKEIKKNKHCVGSTINIYFCKKCVSFMKLSILISSRFRNISMFITAKARKSSLHFSHWSHYSLAVNFIIHLRMKSISYHMFCNGIMKKPSEFPHARFSGNISTCTSWWGSSWYTVTPGKAWSERRNNCK